MTKVNLSRKPTKAGNGSTYLNQFGMTKGLYTGNGITPSVFTIIVPFDPITLVERFDILMASKAAGNTGVRNELASVRD